MMIEQKPAREANFTLEEINNKMYATCNVTNEKYLFGFDEMEYFIAEFKEFLEENEGFY